MLVGNLLPLGAPTIQIFKPLPICRGRRRCQWADIKRETRIAIELAKKASVKSRALRDDYDQLEKSLAKWKSAA
jgi:hypothetical protein